LSVAALLAGITFDELQSWLKAKAKDNESWKVIVTNPTIFKTAHMFASKQYTVADYKPVAMISGLEGFKQFLIHLFVLSILWVHFKHADDWNEGNDVGNEKLTYDEFKMACRTFISAQANETLTEDKILADFALLDLDKSGSVEFIEVRFCFQDLWIASIKFGTAGLLPCIFCVEYLPAGLYLLR
jgi:hypothetical protein